MKTPARNNKGMDLLSKVVDLGQRLLSTTNLPDYSSYLTFNFLNVAKDRKDY